MSNKEAILLVGKVIGPHGVRGHILVKVLLEKIDLFFKIKIFNSKTETVKLDFKAKKSKKILVCSYHGINTRNDASLITGLQIFCFAKDLPKIKNKNEFYRHQLIGLNVFNKNLDLIGQIINIFNYGAGDIIEIKFLIKEETVLLPFNQHFFPTVDNKYIIFNETNYFLS